MNWNEYEFCWMKPNFHFYYIFFDRFKKKPSLLCEGFHGRRSLKDSQYKKKLVLLLMQSKESSWIWVDSQGYFGHSNKWSKYLKTAVLLRPELEQSHFINIIHSFSNTKKKKNLGLNFFHKVKFDNYFLMLYQGCWSPCLNLPRKGPHGELS